jgi:hypothetical protein
LEILRAEPVVPILVNDPLAVYDPRQAPHPLAAKRSRLNVVLGILSAAVCFASIGILTWGVVAVLAALRHSRALAGMSVGYAALFIYWMFAIPLQQDAAFYTLRMSTGVVALLATTIGGAFHVGFLTLAPSRRAVERS